MPTQNGWSTSDKSARMSAQFNTIEPVRTKQWAMTTLAHMFVYPVTTGTFTSGSTTTSLALGGGHSAKSGDVIRFTSGALSGQEVKIYSTDSTTATPAEDLPSAPANTDTYELLRHKYPKVDSSGVLQTSVTISQMKIWDGTNQLGITAAGEAKVNAAQLPTTLGQKTLANSLSVGLASDQVLPLPTGAATAAKQPALGTAGSASADVISIQGIASMTALKVDGSGVTQPISGSVTVSGTVTTSDAANGSVTGGAAGSKSELAGGQYNTSLPSLTNGQQSAIQLDSSGRQIIAPLANSSIVKAQLQDNAGTAVTVGQKAMASSLPVAIASDQGAVPASQSGTWSTRTQDGSGNAITSAAVGSNQGMHKIDLGYAAKNHARNDYTGTSVTTAAYTQLIASTAAECQEVEIFDSSGQTLVLATGGAGSEADQIYIFPGGNGRVKLRIAASTRVSIKAVSATANTGEIDINLYG